MDTIGGDDSEMNKLWYALLHNPMMYCHTKSGDPTGKRIKCVLWTRFSLIFLKVVNSDLVMVRDTVTSHDVLLHQV